jgi:hypothetical protein
MTTSSNMIDCSTVASLSTVAPGDNIECQTVPTSFLGVVGGTAQYAEPFP